MSSSRNAVSLVENNLSYQQKLELRNRLGQVRARLRDFVMHVDFDGAT